MCVCALCSGEQVVVTVKLEREDEEEVSPHVIAPFFPQVRQESRKWSISNEYLSFFLETRGRMVGSDRGSQS